MEVSERRERRASEHSLLEQARELAREVASYYALYWYLYQKGGASFEELWRSYSNIVGRHVRFATVRKQLARLERYRAVHREGDRYVPLVDPEVLLSVVDVRRAQSGRRGAAKRAMMALMGLDNQGVRAPQLRYYVERVVEEVKKLVEKGDRTVALDLIVHTLLPLRENEVLWLWRGSEFVYWDNKTHAFRCVGSEAVADFLRSLGYGEGIMCWHTLGHGRVRRIIRDLFGRGWESWPWARSISYGLMLLGLLGEGNMYQIELEQRGEELWLLLRDYYYGSTLQAYSLRWEYGEPPPPLSNQRQYRGAVLGVAHSKKENAESYFSRWR